MLLGLSNPDGDNNVDYREFALAAKVFIEEQFALIENQEGELVFLAMTVPDYEVMAYNMQEIKRYITELKDVVVYYRSVTTQQEENNE